MCKSRNDFRLEQISCSNFRLKLTCVKDLIVTKIVSQIKFGGGWSWLEARNCFQRQ